MTLYVSDLDGTLLNNAARLDAETVERLNILLDKGVAFTFATARSYSSAGQITKGLRLKLPVITYNGVAIRDASGQADYLFMDKAMLEPLLEDMKREGIAPLVYAVIGGEEKCSWIEGMQTAGIQRYLDLHLDLRSGKRMRPVDDYKALFEGDIYYFSLIGSQTEMVRAEQICGQCKGLGVHLQRDTYHETDWWLELYHGDASKAAAVKKLKAQLGAEKVVCFGDNLNDVPMFNVADECYAVANAREELKKIATAVIASNEECGVAKWMTEHATF